MKDRSKTNTENGQGLIEYIVLLAMLMSVMLLVLNLTGLSISELYCRIVTQLGVEGVCDASYCQDSFESLDNWNLRRDRGWEAVDGRLCNTKSGEQHIYSLCSQEKSRESYSVHLENVVLDRGGNGYGIFYNMQETDPVTGYAFQYDPNYGSGAFVVRKWVNGYEVNPPIVRKSADIDWYDVEHDLTLDVNGNVVRGYLDGELITEYEDDTYTGGSAGLRTWGNARMCVDNFTIDPLY